MYRVPFMGPRRGRESLGHESRDDALRFLAKHAASVSSDVRIIAEDGSTERFPSSNEASFYESQMSFSTVVPCEGRAGGADEIASQHDHSPAWYGHSRCSGDTSSYGKAIRTGISCRGRADSV